MEPIVSPWIIYGIDIVPRFGFMFAIFGGIGLVGGLIYNLIFCSMEATKRVWSIVYVSSALLIVGALVPCRSTIIGMAVAQNITADRISETGKGIKTIKDEIKRDILDIISEVKKEAK